MSSFDRFEVIPAVDIKDGEAVQLTGGKRDSERRYGDPVEAAVRWVEEGARILHLVDLDGAFEGDRVNAEAIGRIVESVDVNIQLGGGIRTVKDATTLLSQGIDRVILGTMAIQNPPIVRQISDQYPGSVMVSLDSKEGEVMVQGWTETTGLDPIDAATRYERLGAGSILFTNIDIEGRLEGVRVLPVKRVVKAVDIPVVASGGVATIDDIKRLASAGARGVVIGTALYEKRFSLQEAIESVNA